jgi:hypothetical protein
VGPKLEMVGSSSSVEASLTVSLVLECSQDFLALRQAVLGMVLGVGAVLTWSLSLPKWGLMLSGYVAFCAVPLPVDVGLMHYVFGLGRLFLAWLPSLPLVGSLPLQTHMP